MMFVHMVADVCRSVVEVLIAPVKIIGDIIVEEDRIEHVLYHPAQQMDIISIHIENR